MVLHRREESLLLILLVSPLSLVLGYLARAFLVGVQVGVKVVGHGCVRRDVGVVAVAILGY